MSAKPKRQTPAAPVRRVRLRQRAVDACASDLCSKAQTILARAYDSAEALLKAYDIARSRRGGRSRQAPRGMSTDEEQDLLRAMLVMAAAGLDSMVKQLVRDALRPIVRADLQAQRGLERYISARLQSASPGFLSSVLASPSPTEAVNREYVSDLTGSSLQSASELARAASAFGLEPGAVGIDFEELRAIYDVRNKIIHELDINFETPRRVRTVRQVGTMVRHTNALLRIGEQFLLGVDGKVNRLGAGVK